MQKAPSIANAEKNISMNGQLGIFYCLQFYKNNLYVTHVF